MMVRKIDERNLLEAMRLAWSVYASDVITTQDPESVRRFQDLIYLENIRPRVKRGEVIIYGAWEDNQMIGVGAIDQSGQMLMMFVIHEYQGRGVEKCLKEALDSYCKIRKKSKRTVWIVLGIVSAITIAIVLGTMMIAKELQRNTRSAVEFGFGEDNPFQYGEDEGVYIDTSNSGLDTIPVYEEEGISYTIEDEAYQFAPTDMTATYIQFEVNYPVIEGLNDSVSKQVNDEIKQCAMSTVDRLYDNPDEEFKEKILGEDEPVIADFVKYKITYLSEEFVCVCFEDYSYEGTQEDSYVNLRTVNINLKDGTVYSIKDILHPENGFLKEWKKGMRSEAEDETLLEELKDDEIIRILFEEDTDIYQSAYFVDADGIEIGLSFHYEKDDGRDHGFGWVTAPFSKGKISQFKTDSEFWDLIK